MKPSTKSRKFLYHFSWTLLVVAATLVVFFNRVAITDTIMGIGFEPSAEMQTITADIKLTSTGERILRASRPEIQTAENFNQNCPSDTDSATLGCYYKQHIYVYGVENDELRGIKQSVLAHELLHAAWSRMTNAERNEIGVYLTQVYESYREEFEKHMEIYTDDSRLDELHSVIGTEIKPSELPEKLRQHYAKYFADHAVVYKYFSQYHDKFAAIQQRIDDLQTQIDAKQSQLDVETAKYNQAYDSWSHDVEIFNNRANSEGGFASRYDFDQQRAALVERRDALDKDYQKLSVLTDELNDLIGEYNQNLVRSTRLYDSIDSRVSKPDDHL